MEIAVFCGSRLGRNPHFQSAAHDLGRLIALHGHTLVYGGSNLGYMGTVSSAALAEGGTVVGIIPTFFSSNIIHSQAVTELVLVESLSERKKRMAMRSDAFIALPGGIGTLDEISEMLAYSHLGRLGRNKPLGLLNVDNFFTPLLEQFQLMREEGLYSGPSADSVVSADTPELLLKKLSV